MKRLYAIFIKGLFTLLPITLTCYIVVWAATRLEATFSDPLRQVIPDSLYFPGLGFLLSLIVIFITGLIVNNYLAAQGLAWVENKVQRIPFIKTIYGPIHDVMHLFGNGGNGNMKRVVMVELSPGGPAVIGLVTRDNFSEFGNAIGAESVAVYVPYSFALGGTTIIVPKSRTREIDIPVDRAMQLAITGWIQSS